MMTPLLHRPTRASSFFQKFSNCTTLVSQEVLSQMYLFGGTKKVMNCAILFWKRKKEKALEAPPNRAA